MVRIRVWTRRERNASLEERQRADTDVLGVWGSVERRLGRAAVDLRQRVLEQLDRGQDLWERPAELYSTTHSETHARAQRHTNTHTERHTFAFSRCFYPKRLTVHSGYTFLFFCEYMCSLGIEPTTFALLTQCSTTEPQEHMYSCTHTHRDTHTQRERHTHRERHTRTQKHITETVGLTQICKKNMELN